MPNRDVLAANTGSYALVAHLRMNVIGEIEHRCTHRQLEDVALWREDKHLIFLKVEAELVHELGIVVRLESATDACQPFLHATFARANALVAPMCSQSVLGNIVHSFCTNLHLNPFLFRSENRDVEAFVAVALGHRKPVAHTFRVALVHIGNDTEHLPALHLLAFRWRVEDDANGKEVIDAIHIHMLLLHLLPDGMDALRAAFHMVVQTCSLEFLVERFQETLDIGIAAAFRLVELLFDMIVGIMLEVFEAEVLQLALELIEAELMSQRRIEISSFHRDFLLCLDVLRVFDLTHHADAIGNHDEDDAHVLGKGDEQAAEVLASHGSALRVELADAHQAVQDVSHLLAEIPSNLIERSSPAFHYRPEQDAQHAAPRQTDFLSYNQGSLGILHNRVYAEDVSLKQTLFRGLFQVSRQFLLIALLNNVGSQCK